MLERVVINNFRCLKHVEAELRPLTVLIGPNDTGKSAFLDAIFALFLGGALDANEHWQLDRTNPINISGSCGQKVLSLGRAQPGLPSSIYTPFLAGKPLELVRSPLFTPGPGSRTERAKTILQEAKRVSNGGVAVYDLLTQGPPMLSGGHPDRGTPPDFGEHGEGVPALLDYLLRRDRKRFEELVEAARQRVPGLQDVNVATPEAGLRRLDFRLDSGLEIPADRASVGVRMILFFIALTYHPTPPGIILLEEPEKGVHPRRLADIMNLLRDITKGVHCGHPAQIILTTHSPYLLDHVKLDEDQVLVFRRNDDGSRSADPLDKDRLKTFLDDFMLGEVWFNEQEDGLIKRGD